MDSETVDAKTAEARFLSLIKAGVRAPLNEDDKKNLADLRKIHGVDNEGSKR